MSANPFAPPNAEVRDVAPTSGTDTETPWFPVSQTKFVVMCLCTLTMYQVYWFYKNWSLVRRRENSSIIPAARAIFGVFFCYQMFAKVAEHGQGTGAPSFAAGPLATGWIVLALLWRLPEPYWWIAFAAFLLVLPVQARANAINAALVPDHDRNSRFSALNWVAIVPGGILLLMAIIGTFLPET